MAVSTIAQRRAIWENSQSQAAGGALMPSMLKGALVDANTIPVPEWFGANADGETDDVDHILAAQTAGKGAFRLAAGSRYFIGKDANLGRIIPEGGTLFIADGVTVKFGAVIGADNVTVFEGPGIAKPRNNKYSMGWYAGATGIEKLRAMNRAMTTSPRKIVVMPASDTSDPAHKADEYGSPGWSLPEEWVWDDPQNNMRIDWQAPLVATTYGMECMIRISTLLNKTEDQTVNELHLDCSDKALNGIIGHGGARIRLQGKSRITNPVRSCYHWPNDLHPADQLFIDFLTFARWGTIAVNIEGRGPNKDGVNCLNGGAELRYIHDNGARGLYGIVTSVSAGAITGLTIDAGQKITGFEPGSTYRINGAGNSAGYGATATASVGATNGLIDITTVAIASGGSSFAVGDKIMLTTAENVVRWRGWLVAPKLHRVVQVSNPPQTSQFGSLVEVIATADGATRKGTISSLDSEVRNRRMLLVGTEAGATTFMHSLTITDVHDEYTPQDPNQFPVELDFMNDGTISHFNRLTTASVTIRVGNQNVSNLSFLGIPKERISFFAPTFTLDGEPTYYATSRPIDSVFTLQTKPFGGMVSMRRVTLVTNAKDGSNVPTVYGSWYMIDDNTLIPAGPIGALVDVVNGAGSSGTSGTAGRFRLSISNGVLFGENRVMNGLRPSLVATR